MNLILTTFPDKSSANVGDLLITASFVDLARSIGVLDDCETLFRGTPLTDEMLATYARQPIFLPGMSVSSNSYPKLFPLRDNLEEIPRGLIPFGCTWQHPIGYLEHAEIAGFSASTRALLELIVQRTGPISARDHMAAGILLRNGIPATTVGDCAWYHLPSNGKAMRRPRTVGRILVTTPHSADLVDQSIDLVEMLRAFLPGSTLTIALHSRTNPHTSLIVSHARDKGLTVIEAAGREEIFDQYDEFDLHVGHRLHGHIGFIRRRIPSVLLMEDARSRGFSSSISVGCFAAKKSAIGPDILARIPLSMAREHMAPDQTAVTRVREFLEQELATGFLRYSGISGYLDAMLDEVVIPQLREKVELAKRAIAPA